MGFYGFIDMPTDFQKAMNYTLQKMEGVISCVDYILVATKDDFFGPKLLV